MRRDALSSPGGAAQIVANGRNGLDVDKFDYLQRDSMYCNVRISADFDRIQKYSKVPHRSACAHKVSVLCSGTSTPCAAVMQVIDDEICYRWSEYENMRVPLDLTTFLLLH